MASFFFGQKGDLKIFSGGGLFSKKLFFFFFFQGFQEGGKGPPGPPPPRVSKERQTKRFFSGTREVFAGGDPPKKNLAQRPKQKNPIFFRGRPLTGGQGGTKNPFKKGQKPPRGLPYPQNPKPHPLGQKTPKKKKGGGRGEGFF